MAILLAQAVANEAADPQEGRLRTRMLRWVMLRQALILEHVQQRCLARIIKAKE